jgi:hypothetical protein
MLELAVKTQTQADVDVANGKINEGDYLKYSEITKQLYHNVSRYTLCECGKEDPQVEDEDDNEDVIAESIMVKTDNSINMTNTQWRREYINKQVLISNELYEGNRKMVHPIAPSDEDEYTFSISIFSNIYYDTSDSQFKEDTNWIHRHV